MFNSGIRGRRAKDGEGTVSTQSGFVQKSNPQPTISSYIISGIDDTALDTAGGQTVVVIGTGFATGISGTIGGTQLGAVTFVNSNQVTFTSPAKSAGSHALVLYNSTGGAAILVPGITYSSVPTYTTAAGSIGTVYETKSINTSVVATSDSALTYSLDSGTLPAGATLSSNGTITGTAPIDSASTTYTFSIKATDTELQDVTRTFTLTVNTDVVTWATPTNGSTITLDGTNYSQALSATAASGYSVSYSANSLPTGLTLSSGTISGSPTVEGTSTTLLTATAATSNRTGTNTITWVVILGDNYWNYTSLLLNGSTPTTSFINDASLNNAQLTIQGDTKPNNFNPYTQGYYSNYFDGTGDYLSSTSNASITTGTFTFECWIYPTALGTNRAIINNGYWNIGDNGGYRLFFTSGNQIQLQASTGTWNTFPTVIQSSTTITAAYRWYHIAIVRDVSDNINLYINGVVAATPVSYSASLNLGAGQTLKIGGSIADGSLYDPWVGYISNLRIVNGTALYTSAFTPPTTPLTLVSGTQLLTCQSNRLIDNSTNNFTLTKNGDVTVSSAHPFISNSSYSTYGSAYFDGTGDYLSAPASVVNNLTGTWTVEAWCYMLQAPTGNTYATSFPILTVEDGAGTISHYWGVGSTAFVCMTRDSSSYDTITGTMPGMNQWFHIAVTNVGSTVSFYINGVLAGSKTQTAGTWNSTQSVVRANIGALYTYNYAKGHIADLRIVNGTALYSSNFLPPQTPLTPVTNTSLLTLQYNGGANNNGFVDQSSFNNIITRVNNTTLGTFSPYSQTGWSTYFDGSQTNQFFTLPTAAATALGGFATNFTTIEFWAYQTTTSTSATNEVIGTWAAVAADGRFYVEIGNGAASTGAPSKVLFQWTTSTGTTDSVTTTAVVPVYQWAHIAIVVNATGTAGTHTVNIYVNGTGQSFTARNFSSQTSTYDRLRIAGNSSTYFNGYLSNFRIVRATTNIVGYTGSSISVPTAPFSVDSNTKILISHTNKFVDYSFNNIALTISGSPSIQPISPFGGVTSVPASYSTYFDGTGDNLTVGTTAISLPTATTPFTMEAWIYVTAFTGLSIMATNYSSGGIPFNLGLNNGTNTTASAGGYPFMSFYSGSTWTYAVQSTSANSTALSLNTWYHVAGVYSGTTAKIFVNGVETVSSNISSWQTTASAAGGINIGRKWDTSTPAYFSGYISNARLVIGTAVYTANFTPSTTPLTAIANTTMLTCQSATMIDNSTNNYVITGTGDAKPSTFNPFGTTTTKNVSYTPSVNGGSMYFDGVDDYLTLPNSTNYNLTGDFTIECWVYPTATLANSWAILDARVNGASAAPWSIGLANSTGYKLDLWTGTSYRGTKTINLNEWTHVVWTRSGSSLRSYVNGILDYNNASYGTGAISPGATTPWIGSKDNGLAGYDTQGYISDLRFTNGASLYTNNFVPPIQPLTPSTTIGSNVYNSTVLVNGTSGGIIDYHSTNNLETVGNTQLASEDPYAGIYYSNYFNGTTDGLSYTIPSGGTGNFTVEAWALPTSTSRLWVIGSTNATQSYGITIESGYVNGWWNYMGGPSISGNTPVILGQWVHVALVREGSVIYLYVNGIKQTNTATGVSGAFGNSSSVSIGWWGAGPQYSTGYISNLRVVDGTALYTPTLYPSGFTPSTTPLTAISGTKILTCQTNKFVDNSTNANTITITGTPKVKSMNPFQQNTGKSLYFDGTGDYLSFPTSYLPTVAGVAFTLEFWIYPTRAFSTDNSIISSGNIELNIVNPSGQIRFDLPTGVTNVLNSGTNYPTLYAWNHIALVRTTANAYTLYLNGVSVGTGSSSTAITTLTTFGYRASNSLQGYISDLRVTNGVARYASTFTPSTIPFKIK